VRRSSNGGTTTGILPQIFLGKPICTMRTTVIEVFQIDVLSPTERASGGSAICGRRNANALGIAPLKKQVVPQGGYQPAM
jgi:hypothetical protein